MSILILTASSTVTGRRPPRPKHVIEIGRLTLDLRSRTALVAGLPAFLTRVEYDLLRTLASEPTRVFSKQELYRRVWGTELRGRSLDSQASRLRRKLNVYGDRFVVNVWGVGYRLTDAS